MCFKVVLLLLFGGALVLKIDAQSCGFQTSYPTTTTESWLTTTTTEFSSNIRNGSQSQPQTQMNHEYSPTKDSSERDIGYFYVRDSHPIDEPFAVLQTYNIMFALSRSGAIRIEIDDNQMASFYITNEFYHLADVELENSYGSFNVHLRCTDGSSIADYLFINIINENNRPPIFSPSSLDLTVAQPWPSEIPINLQKPLFVEDLDHHLSDARISISSVSPDILTTNVVPLPQPSLGKPHDYKIELFIKPNVSTGEYNVQLIATDGVHQTPYNVSVSVTEVICKGQESDPIFGRPGTSTKLTYYNATLNSIPAFGEPLKGVLVEAFDPDNICAIELTILNTDFLEVSSTGQVIFTKSISLQDIEGLGRTWIVEIKATEPKSGKTQKIPLFITNDLESIHTTM